MRRMVAEVRPILTFSFLSNLPSTPLLGDQLPLFLHIPWAWSYFQDSVTDFLSRALCNESMNCWPLSLPHSGIMSHCQRSLGQSNAVLARWPKVCILVLKGILLQTVRDISCKWQLSLEQCKPTTGLLSPPLVWIVDFLKAQGVSQ